jgi:hypothetical protein
MSTQSVSIDIPIDFDDYITEPKLMTRNVGKTLKEAIIPLVWFEELAEVDDNSKDTIKYVFVYPIKYEEVVAFGLIILGGVLLITSLCCCCCCGGKNKVSPDIDCLSYSYH